MRLVTAEIVALGIPFVEAFAHSAKDRSASDAVLVKVVAEDGTVGWGEGLPRPYVTGETTEGMIAHVADVLWPAIAERELPPWSPDLPAGWLPDLPASGVVAPHAARAALELAMLDASLRAAGQGVADHVPVVRRQVTYSGVVTAADPARAAKLARQMKLVGLTAFKVKVGVGDDAARVAAVREVVGPDAELRVDANGAWATPEAAAAALAPLAALGVVSCEQPLPRGDVRDLARLRALTGVALMADESLVTEADADALIDARAVDLFNVRVSKNGGLARALAIAAKAAAAGIGVQVGSQVGETAVLSAAGRHLACAVAGLRWAEGSFGTLLLAEDVAAEPVRFGHKGLAGAIGGPGLGVRVREDLVRKYAREVRTLGSAVAR
jgi:muconate cycloisomerase